MNEKPDNLEAELSKMQPAALPGGLADRIEAGINDARASATPWADRFLLATMSAGALAACVIVAVLTMQNSFSVEQNSTVNLASVAPRAPEAPLAFVRADSAWFEGGNP